MKHRNLFFFGAIATAIVFISVVSLGFNGLFSNFNQKESFSEIWILPPTGIADGYIYNLGLNEETTLVVGVGNHIGSQQQFLVYGKICDQDQLLTGLSPSNLSPILENQSLIADNEDWEFSLRFKILHAEIKNNSLTIRIISINDNILELECSSKWNSEKEGYLFQLFFELWIFDSSISDFRYDNRFVSLWINVSD